MSTISKAAFDPTVAALTKAVSHFAANPSTATADLLTEGQKALAGLENVAQDVPALMTDGENLGPLVVKLIADLAAQKIAPADIIAFVKALPAVFADLRKALADFKAGEAA